MTANPPKFLFILENKSKICPIIRIFFLCCTTIYLAGCQYRDREHTMLVSVLEQKMQVYKRGQLLAEYPVSTSRFGLGNRPGSHATPLGKLQIRKKIGTGAPLGTVFKSRRPTGEILRPNAPGRDPIVTRILWLDGMESQNSNTFGRTIYIHGTPEESKIGQPASYGCIRMKSSDVVQLYDIVGLGAEITITDQPIPANHPPGNEIVSVGTTDHLH